MLKIVIILGLLVPLPTAVDTKDPLGGPWSGPLSSLPLPAPLRLDLGLLTFGAPSELLPSPLCWRVPSPCEQIAVMALQSALSEARADYLLAVGNCINEGGSVDACLQSQLADYEAAKATAEAQHCARLDVCKLLGGGVYDPDIDPEDMSPVIDNPWFPFPPGRTLRYRKITDAGTEIVEVGLRPETIIIDGIECAVVRDVVRLDGVLVEDTDDWYAQDDDDNVWYMGELAKNYEDGQLTDLDGSWTSGKDNALAGIVMLETARVGDAYRQEFFLNEAEDLATVVSVNATVTVPYGTFKGCIETRDSSPLEPGKAEQKFYAPGIGFVLAINSSGERTELIEVIDR